jgi:exportin-5
MQQRQQGAFVLDLLKDLKGVSISEQGRISKTAVSVRKEMSKMQKEFMKVQVEEPMKKQDSPELDGVAGMFES